MRNTGALSKKSKPRNSTAPTTFLAAILLLATTTSISAPAIESEANITRKAISDKIKALIIKPASHRTGDNVTIQVTLRPDGYATMIIGRKGSGNEDFNK